MLADWFNDRISPLDVLAMDDPTRRILIACPQARKRRYDAAERRARRDAEKG